MVERVVICGAGLAGPALAIALAKQNIKSTILEKSPEIRDIGGVIMLGTNAMNVLDKVVGVGEQLRDKGYAFDSINIYVQSGKSLVLAGGFKTGTGTISISRPVLHKTLLDECRRRPDLIDVRYSAALERIEETSDSVTAILSSGERVQGDVLVGADGIGSRVRNHILPDAPAAQYAGFVMSGTITPLKQVNLPKGTMLPAFYYTSQGGFLSFRMSSEDNADLQWATSIEKPARDRKTGWSRYSESGEAADDLKQTYSGVTEEPLKSFIESADAKPLRCWAPYELPPLRTWHTDRVVLAGDAAHAIPPSVGQGSAMAFEDIGLLARLLGSKDALNAGLPKLLSFYERVRKQRVEYIRDAAHRAESQRKPTANAAVWWLKSLGIRTLLYAFGKNGYVGPAKMVTYDVTDEKLGPF